MNGIKIGDNVFVGLGTVVNKSVESNVSLQVVQQDIEKITVVFDNDCRR